MERRDARGVGRPRRRARPAARVIGSAGLRITPPGDDEPGDDGAEGQIGQDAEGVKRPVALHLASGPNALVAAGVGWFRPAIHADAAAAPAMTAGRTPAVAAVAAAPPTVTTKAKIFSQVDLDMWFLSLRVEGQNCEAEGSAEAHEHGGEVLSDFLPKSLVAVSIQSLSSANEVRHACCRRLRLSEDLAGDELVGLGALIWCHVPFVLARPVPRP